MLDSDWSSQNVLRSDWLGPLLAPITTSSFFFVKTLTTLIQFRRKTHTLFMCLDLSSLTNCEIRGVEIALESEPFLTTSFSFLGICCRVELIRLSLGFVPRNCYKT